MSESSQQASHGASSEETSAEEEALSSAAMLPMPMGGGSGELSLLGMTDGGLDIPQPYANVITLVERTYLVGCRAFDNSGADDAMLRSLRTRGSDGRLRLQREPDDAQDRWTVEAYAGETRVGYLRAHENEIIARLMDAGKHVYAEHLETERLGDYRRIWVRLVLDD
ncbi:HIRAN domain-containing protein [Bifidobacterium sp. 82T24]|uniref:HIRAN domain-containing protein n=1 Tax=Bifidobacterium pluvialisilvae TaxID=2834436 RepID=UPI001C55EEAF|nr:HIRAN domain-containing protein [Bifidobacterium pluvialisilvae]MBW3089073.1 HIRAN domain-containing protein [Bifidobacterium pluvialisilvae]